MNNGRETETERTLAYDYAAQRWVVDGQGYELATDALAAYRKARRENETEV